MNRRQLSSLTEQMRGTNSARVVTPQVTTQHRAAADGLFLAYSNGAPKTTTSFTDPTTGKIRFAWGLFGFPDDDLTDWIMT